MAAAKMSAGVSGRRGRRAAGTVDRPHIRPARDRLVRFRYSAVEYGAVSDAARRAGYTVSGYIAETALAAAGQRDDVRPASGLDRELLVALNAAREQMARIGTNFNQAVARFHATGEVAFAGAGRSGFGDGGVRPFQLYLELRFAGRGGR